MSDAKKGTIPWNKGIPCKDSTKEKLSDAISYLHQTGHYPLKIKSKGHAEIEQILLDLNYDVISEFKLGKYSYDLYIKDISLIIEFHGTYWHLDPKIYKEEDIFTKLRKKKEYKEYVDGLDEKMYIKGKTRKVNYDTNTNSNTQSNGELIKQLYLEPFRFK
jgi:hypothetical protein